MTGYIDKAKLLEWMKEFPNVTNENAAFHVERGRFDDNTAREEIAAHLNTIVSLKHTLRQIIGDMTPAEFVTEILQNQDEFKRTMDENMRLQEEITKLKEELREEIESNGYKESLFNTELREANKLLEEERDEWKESSQVATGLITSWRSRAILAEKERRDLDEECELIGRDKARIANDKAKIVEKFVDVLEERDALLDILQRLDSYVDFSELIVANEPMTYEDPSGINEVYSAARSIIAKYESVSVHINGDKNMSNETKEAIARAAEIAYEQYKDKEEMVID